MKTSIVFLDKRGAVLLELSPPAISDDEGDVTLHYLMVNQIDLEIWNNKPAETKQINIIVTK